MSFAGLRVLTLESRKASDMETLILREEGIPTVAPAVRERSNDDDGTGIRFVEQLEAGMFDMVIFMTGVGLAFLRDTVSRHVPVERFSAALARATIVSRGPKPVGVLRQIGLTPNLIIPEPNTWKEIVTAVAGRAERRIAVQEYGRPNVELNNALEQLGAKVTAISVYKWEMPADLEPLRNAARGLARGEFDVVLFTSSVQLDHLLEIAAQLGIGEAVEESLAKRVAIASVGPVMTATLKNRGLPVDIEPRHPKMWALVKAASEEAAAVISSKNK